MQQTTQRHTRASAHWGLELLPLTQVASLKVLLPKRSRESVVLAGLLIIGLIPWWVFLQNLLNHVIVHVFSLASCIHYFSPQGPFPGISRKWKKPLWLSWNAWKPPHLLLEGKEQISWILCLSLIHPLQLLVRPVPLKPSQVHCALAPWPKGRWFHLLGPWCGAGGNVVVCEIAKLCDYIKVNTIYLHFLSCGLKKGHHC